MTTHLPEADLNLRDGHRRSLVTRHFTDERWNDTNWYLGGPDAEWETRTIRVPHRGGDIERAVRLPRRWSDNAAAILYTHYLRVIDGIKEDGLDQTVRRIVGTYTEHGLRNGYFTEEEAILFRDELAFLLVDQRMAFNSPVWYNVGVPGRKQAISACFILSVDDTMDSIKKWWTTETSIFQGGSGAGTNLSRIRGSAETISTGGTASGPVSFMRGADAIAGTIKSGGSTRRAAKMVVLDVDHPDIREFVACKAREERKARVLADGGYDMSMSSPDHDLMFFQNANNSVRVSDEFMIAVQDDGEWELHSRVDHSVTDTVSAKKLFRDIATAAWECADPGIQYDDTINDWHTLPEAGRINASNPCSEYMHIDNSSCNLASLNLVRFLDGREFQVPDFVAAVRTTILAQDISIAFGEFPTEEIGENTRRYRQLGIGYANLGALLMIQGWPYDSDEGRLTAAEITSLMSATAYQMSGEIAAVTEPFHDYGRHVDSTHRVMEQHLRSHEMLPRRHALSAIRVAAQETWSVVCDYSRYTGVGLRNSQISVLAPTGTISFVMDCDTTGVEPAFGLVTYKKLHGGGSMVLLNRSVSVALRHLGYSSTVVGRIQQYVIQHGSIVGAPDLDPAHAKVFQTAVGADPISPSGHIHMMAAVQPFLSGAISKTVNMPSTATVEDIERIYMEAWELKLKAIAVYRDGSKGTQPLSTEKADPIPQTEIREVVKEVIVERPVRQRLPKKRKSVTYSFTVGGAAGYLTVGEFEDGSIGEIFLKLGKQGSTLAGVLDAFAIQTSLALQYGVPLSTMVEKFRGQRFEPSGMTDDSDLRIASSLMDYVFRRLALDYLSSEELEELNIKSVSERTSQLKAAETVEAVIETDSTLKVETQFQSVTAHQDSPLCFSCGGKMRPSGSCHVCESCGTTSGCS